MLDLAALVTLDCQAEWLWEIALDSWPRSRLHCKLRLRLRRAVSSSLASCSINFKVVKLSAVELVWDVACSEWDGNGAGLAWLTVEPDRCSVC
jgi:hypothetical protein